MKMVPISKRNRVFSTVRLTVFNEFSPVTLISRAIGVFPLRLRNVSGNQVFESSLGGLFYLVVLLILTIVYLTYVPSLVSNVENFVILSKNVSHDEQDPRTYQNQMFRFLNPVIVSLMAILSRINSVCYVRRFLPKVFAEIDTIDDLLNTRPKEHRKTFYAIWILVGFNLIIGLPSQVYSATFIYMANSFLIGIYVFCNNFNNLTAISVEFQFLGLCYLLQSRFKIINQRLSTIKTLEEMERPMRANPMNGIHSNLVDINYWMESMNDFNSPEIHLQSSKRWKLVSSTLQDRLQGDKVIFHTIFILRRGHQRLCDVLDQVNSMFQIQILFSLCGCFLNMLFNAYFVFSGGYWTTTQNQEHSTEVPADIGAVNFLNQSFSTICWGIYYLVRLVTLATIASRTINEAKKALIHILEIRRRSWDAATKEELTLFYDHITSRSIIFSAAGFFHLDVSLLSSAFATGSTYLVIMAQFHTK